MEELARIDENAESKKESLEEGEGDMDEMHAGLSTRDLEQLVTVGTLQDDGLLQVPYVARCVFCTQQTLFTEMPTKKSNRICMRVIGTRVLRGARVERRCRQKSKARAFVMFTKEIARTDQNAKCKRDFKDTNASLADDEVQLGKLCPQGRQSIFSKKPCLSTKEFASTGEKVGKSNSIEIQTAEEKGQKHKRRETRSAPHAAFNTLQLCFEEESLEELARIDENAESKKESLEEGEGDMDEMHAGLSTR
ncbi:MAG: hypothetical protein QGH82_03450, partial [Candidatus Woesearchaeota archaeon]|nr:hypothetical protein [Candidatus Woesearchaeota archaeon]